MTLRDLPENALGKANAKLASGVMPYRFEQMKDFHMGYLSGFQAERRDIACEAVQERMRQTMRESAERLMSAGILRVRRCRRGCVRRCARVRSG